MNSIASRPNDTNEMLIKIEYHIRDLELSSIQIQSSKCFLADVYFLCLLSHR